MNAVKTVTIFGLAVFYPAINTPPTKWRRSHSQFCFSRQSHSLMISGPLTGVLVHLLGHSLMRHVLSMRRRGINQSLGPPMD